MKKNILLMLLAFTFLTGGCQQQQERNVNEQDQMVKVNDPTGNYKEEKSNQEIAKYLADLTAKIPNVKDSTAVVIGNYTIVGIDIDSELDRSRVSTIKYTVAESLKKDPYGANAVVVADADTFERLDRMATKIANGEPTEGVMDELASIIGRIMPEVPSEVHEEKAPNDDAKGQLPEKEEQELDNIQRKQANNKQESL